MRILLVEDDVSIATGLCSALKRAHYSVDWVADGRDAILRLASHPFELMILDLGLPGKDGFQVLKHARDKGLDLSILILSARDASADRVQGLDMGADDYLSKPFDLNELFARIRALQRRRSSVLNNQLTQGELALDTAAMTVHWQGNPIELPRKEWMLLRLFLENPRRVHTREQIEHELYGLGETAESNAIDVHVHHLRKKIAPQVIQTVRGVGYRLGDLA